jgi:PAS domain S-box-containing protein
VDRTDLDSAVPVSDELDLVADAPGEPAGAYETDRLLSGRFFTIAGGGTVSAWNARAQATFGFTNAAVVGESFVEQLVAPSHREKRGAEVAALLGGDAPPVALHIEGLATNADGHEFRERFSIVPIRLQDGYELNGLLQEIAKQRDIDEVDRLRTKHSGVLGVIQDALAGRVPPPAGGEDAERRVGALVIFDGADAPILGGEEEDEPADDLNEARRQVDELRARLEDAKRAVEEARNEAKLARAEVETTRTKLSDVRGSADGEHDRARRLEEELAELRAVARAAEAELPELRARAEQAEAELEGTRAALAEAAEARDALASEVQSKQAEVDAVEARGTEQTEALRRELEEARSARDEAAERLAGMETELADLSEKREELAAELDAKRTELSEVAGRRDELAGKLDATGADLAEVAARRGELAEELEARRSELVEVAGRRDELAAALEAKEKELAEAASEREGLAAAVDAKEAELSSARAGEDESEALRSELDQLRDELARREEELVQARAAADEAKADAERRQARVDELVETLQEAQQRAERAVAEAEAVRVELDAANSAAEEARLKARGAIGELDEVRRQVELFRGAFDTAPIGMALTATDGRFVKVNATLCEELGYTQEQLLSDDPPSIVHPDDVEANREVARRLLAGEIKTSRAERRYVHADGHEIHMRESVALLRDGEDTPLLFIFQLEDATERTGLGGASESAGLGSASGGLPVPLGGHEDEVEETLVEGPFLSPDRVRQALESDQFVLYCQPVLDLKTNEVSQYELLIRMVDDEGRLILPQAFLKPAEQSGLIRSIDHWVVRRAIRLIAENRQAGRDVRIEVNVSPESLGDRDLLGVLDQELASTAIDPANLVVEVTESAAVANPEGTSALAKGVRGLGARFALDDFGSTFGSFRHLKDLPLDYLKIDGDLVGSLTESRTAQLVVKALVDVARGTGTETIAVFVSEEETLALLRQHGVGYAQGYVVGRPQPLSEVFADGRAALPSAG